MEISPPFSTGVEKLVEMTSAVVKMGGYRRRASRAAYIPSTDCKRVISTGNTQQSGVLKGESSCTLPESFIKQTSSGFSLIQRKKFQLYEQLDTKP